MLQRAVDEAHLGLADERGDVQVARGAVDLARRAELDDLAVAHDRDEVGQAHRLLLVVGHEDAGRAQLQVEVLDLGAHPAAQARVKVAERLVEQEHERFLDQGPPEGDALLLSARHLARLALHQVGDVESLGDRPDASPDLVLRTVLELQTEGDVVERREVRVERVILEDHRHPTFVGRRVGDVLVAQQDTTLIEPVEPGDQAEGRALAAAGRPEERHEGAGRDGQRQVVDRADGPVVA